MCSYVTDVNGFKLRCMMILFMDGAHLSGPSKGTLLASWMQTTTFLIAHMVQCQVKKLKNGYGSCKRLLSVQGSEAHDNVGQEPYNYHCYCTSFWQRVLPLLLTTLEGEFLEGGSQAWYPKRSNQINSQGNFYIVGYASTVGEHNAPLEELRCYKSGLIAWVENNKLEQQATYNFGKERWRRMNNNVIERWNNQMRRLQPMAIRWLVNSCLKKIRKKMNKHKQDIIKWKNKVVRELRRNYLILIRRWVVS